VIDLSKLKAPGWQRVVSELLAPAPSEQAYLMRLLAVMAQVSGARQGALILVPGDGEAGETEPRVLSVWPSAPGGEGLAMETEGPAKSAARNAAEAGEVRLFGLDKGDEFYGGSPEGYAIGVPLSESPVGKTVAALLIEQRSKAALQSTLAMVELLAGYVHQNALRQQLVLTKQASASLDLATRLIAGVNDSPSFKGAAMRVCNDLVRQLGVDRVALGWVRGAGESGSVRVSAISDTEHVDRRLAMVQTLEAAMDECFDQEQPVLFPAPPERQTKEGGDGAGAEEPDMLLSQAITHAHRELAGGDQSLRIASLPLRVEDETLGVVLIESSAGGAIDVSTVELLQATFDLLAPVLRIRQSDDRNLAVRAWASIRKGAAWLVGAKHTVWKLAALAVLALLVTVTFVHVEYRVDARAEIRPRTRQVVSAPQDGQIVALGEGVKPGARVEKGQLLVQFDTTDLELSAAEARAMIRQAETRRQAAAQQGELAEAEQAKQERERERARLDRILEQIERARITAPISGTIVSGDLTERVGSAVRLGDPLFEIADLTDMIAVARVSDRDIRLITEAAERARAEGDALGGEVATKAYPAKPFELSLERIVPLAQPDEGDNTFEVRAGLQGYEPWLRPGMEGIAKLETGERSLLDIGTRRIRDQLRLWLWW